MRLNGSAVDDVMNNFGYRQLPGCRLHALAVSIGDRVARDTAKRAQNPSLFDAKHPVVGTLLAEGVVPRGIDGFPIAPRAYTYVPLLGDKEIVSFSDPVTKRVDVRAVPNFVPGRDRS